MRKPSDNHRTYTADSRAINDVMGYIIVFALITGTISFVLVSGMTSLDTVRDAEQVANAERAFDVLSDNFAAIYERNAPSRATEIDLGDSEIFYANNVSITVEGDGDELGSYEIRPVELRVTNDESLVYEGGATFRQGPRGAFMLNDPPFLVNQNRVHVPIVQTTSPGLESAGSTTILLRGKSTERAVLESDHSDSYDEITIEIASPRYEAWFDNLDNRDQLDCSTDDAAEIVECTTTNDPDIVFVTLQRIELSLIL